MRLRLPRIAAQPTGAFAQAERGESSLLVALAALLGTEATARESTRPKTSLSISHLPAVKTLEDSTSCSPPGSTGRARRRSSVSISSTPRRTPSSSDRPG